MVDISHVRYALVVDTNKKGPTQGTPVQLPTPTVQDAWQLVTELGLSPLRCLLP